jgi:hypothetical protein
MPGNVDMLIPHTCTLNADSMQAEDTMKRMLEHLQEFIVYQARAEPSPLCPVNAPRWYFPSSCPLASL